MSKDKKNKGITLVALIITIIILVILAGITIIQLNNNGLLKNAKLSKEKYSNSSEDEQVKLNNYSSIIDNLGSIEQNSRDNKMDFIYKITPTSEITKFNYTGNEQEFTAQKDGYYKIECWGAQGGSYGGVYGGKGAYTKGIIKLSKGDNLYVYVGECYNGYKSTMSFNGGGHGQYDNYGEYSMNGGGATDIRISKGNFDNFNSLKSRIMIAGGGGGCFYSGDYNANGGNASALSGQIGNIVRWTSNYLSPAGSASQVNGGNSAFNGKFGIGGCDTIFDGGNSWFYASGGGGGYYGGGSGCATAGVISSASGGSSYISGYEGCNSISEKSTEDNIIHTGNIVHYSNKYFMFAEMQSGASLMPTHDGTGEMTGNSGSGYAKITRVDIN